MDQSEWDALTAHDKHALKTIGRVSPADFEPLRKFNGIGKVKIESLLSKGLVEEGLSFPRRETGYRLTESGTRAYERCIGRRSL